MSVFIIIAGIQGLELNCGYTLLWRKIRPNPLLAEPGRKLARFEFGLYIINVLASGKDDEKTGFKHGKFIADNYFSTTFYENHAMAQRLIDQPLVHLVIFRVICPAIGSAIYITKHFYVTDNEA